MTWRGMRALLGPVAVLAILGGPSAAAGRGEDGVFTARLRGFAETPAISTTGQGTFRAELANGGTEIHYVLTYVGLRAPATVSHIHFGQPGVAGGVVIFLCGGGGRPSCPEGMSTQATVTGTITANDVLALSAQGIDAKALGDVLQAMRAGITYANVHSTKFPAGEIRGQLRGANRDDRDREDD